MNTATDLYILLQADACILAKSRLMQNYIPTTRMQKPIFNAKEDARICP